MAFVVEGPEDELRLKLGRHPVLAHSFLFPHRHPNATTAAHEDMIRWLHSVDPAVLFMAFRGFAKSTLLEEAIVIKAIYRRFFNGLIIGETEDRAAERLMAVRHELDHNERINTIFGSQVGAVWGADKIQLANGVQVMSLGRGQALRGTKHNDQRPDFCAIDDIEREAAVRKPETREQTRKWFMKELVPALDPKGLMRMTATPLDVDALAVRFQKSPEWVTRIYPIEYQGPNNERRPMWPDRFPLKVIDAYRNKYVDQGMLRDYLMEYMCLATHPEEQAFKAEQMRVEPTVRTWQAVYAMFDPARTTNQKSATTGYACWSWIANRLIIWDAWGRLLMPDQIIDAVFQVNEDERPVYVGIEEDGLNEFLLQPIRTEQVRRGVSVPLRALRAPKGKLDFIRGLQPYFNAREVVFSKDLPDLKSQLLSFPTGRIDAPNALAYALRLRPGAPIYDDFGGRHVAEELRPAPRQPAWLCLNATGGLVTGVLAQVLDGSIRIFADWVREGEASAVLADIVKAATLEAGRPVRLLAGPQHFDAFHNFGLKQAVGRIPAELRRGSPPAIGRAAITDALRTERQGVPMLRVSAEATWTANAFAGGYCRALTKAGVLADYAEEGAYRVLMEGIEAMTGLLNVGFEDEANSDTHYAMTPGGRRYISALPRGQ